MSTVTWPAAVVPSSIQLEMEYNSQLSVSPLSGYAQTVELPGFRWGMSLRLPDLSRADGGAAMEAFLGKLRGQANRAQIPVFRRSAPRGTWAGAPAVNNEVGSPTLSQTGNTLQVRAFTPFATWKEGDYFNLGSGGQLLMVTEDGAADSNGLGVLSLNTAIRSAPAHNTLLVSSNPVVPMMILRDPKPSWSEDSDSDGTRFALDFIEVFG